MTWDEVCKFALNFPEVSRAISYNEPSLKFRKSLITRLRQADESIVLLDIPEPEREMLLSVAPQVYFVEQHYLAYDIVLARLGKTTLPDIAPLIERRWRNVAPKQMVKLRDL